MIHTPDQENTFITIMKYIYRTKFNYLSETGSMVYTVPKSFSPSIVTISTNFCTYFLSSNGLTVYTESVGVSLTSLFISAHFSYRIRLLWKPCCRTETAVELGAGDDSWNKTQTPAISNLNIKLYDTSSYLIFTVRNKFLVRNFTFMDSGKLKSLS